MWHSSYFAAATDPDGGFSTSSAKVLEFEGSHAVFGTFYCWMYTGQLKDPSGADASTTEHYLNYFLLRDTWLFADLREILSLCNNALNMLYKLCPANWSTHRRAIKHM